MGAGYPRVVGNGYTPGGFSGDPGPEVVGYVVGAAPQYVVGAPKLISAGAQHLMPLPPQPGWRGQGIGPGVQAPHEGHVAMPLNPEALNGTFISTNSTNTITFTGKPQKPFKMTRLIVTTVKTGATATGRVIGQMFVGTDLQQGELGNIDLEALGAANAFDTWVSFFQAEPGVLVRIQATVTLVPTSPDNILALMTAIGHYVH